MIRKTTLFGDVGFMGHPSSLGPFFQGAQDMFEFVFYYYCYAEEEDPSV